MPKFGYERLDLFRGAVLVSLRREEVRADIALALDFVNGEGGAVEAGVEEEE